MIKKTSNHIMELKKRKNAIILAHHYAPFEIHAVADVLSDSRGFFESLTKKINAEKVIIIAPLFFAEIAAAILPGKKIITPVLSECPVANHRHLNFEAISDFKDQYPDIPLVCYATSPLKTKLLADYITLPGEVVQTINSIDAPEILFVGEKNCAEDALKKCRKKITVYPRNPVCNVYNTANSSDVEQLKACYPDACLMVHPECKQEVTQAADHVMGTGEMYDFIKSDNEKSTYILGTEIGFFQRMQNEFPEKKIFHLNSYLSCNVFKVFRIETVLSALETDQYEVRIDNAVSERISHLFYDLINQKLKVNDFLQRL